MKKLLAALLLTPSLVLAQYFGPIYNPAAVAITGGTINGTSIATSSFSGSSLTLTGNAVASNVKTGATAVTSASGTTVLTSASSRMQNLQGTQPQTFQLPDATTLSIGWMYEFNNNSTGLLTVVDASSGAVTTVPAGGYARVFAIAVSTAAGAWDKHFLMPANASFGTSGLAVTGALSATQGLKLPTVENAVTAHAGGGQASCTALNASATFHRVTTVATSADSVCLPAAVAGAMHYIRNDSTSSNGVQVFGTSPDTINGVTTSTGVGVSKNMGAWFIATADGAWTTTGGSLAISGSGSMVLTNNPVFVTPTLGVATATSLGVGAVNATGKISTAINGNSTQIQIAVRNTDATASGAGQTRVDWGNDASALAATIGLNASTHATKPGWFEVLNQTSAPLLLGSNGNDIVGVSPSGIINGVNSNALLFGTAAPTISSGFGSSPSILSRNGATTFRVDVGTGGTASSGVIGLPTATTGWNCQFSVLNPTSTNMLSVNTETSSTTASVTVTNILISTGAATAWPANTTLIAFCAAY